MIDSHAHLNDAEFELDVDEVINRAKEAGVNKIINVGSDIPSSRRAVKLSEQYNNLYAVVGIHPHEANLLDVQALKEIESLTENVNVVAVGETGLDYYYDNSPREVQKQAFEEQLLLAKRLKMPLVVHSREATADTVELIRKYPDVKCLLHCYSGSWETAKIYIEMGNYISFSGSITFKNANKLRKVAANVPLDKVMIETDSPYLSPEPFRGKRNEPAYVQQVAMQLAEIHQCDLKEITQLTEKNTLDFFELD